MRGLAIAAMVLVAIGSRADGDDGFCADRPGLATGACIVPPGKVQVETSLAAWSLDRSAGVRIDEVDIAPSVFRAGLADGIELQAALDPFVRVRQRSPTRDVHSGIGDAAIGVKARLTRSGAPVTLALFPAVRLPTGSNGLGGGKVETSLLAPVDTDVSPNLSLTLTPELDWAADDHGHHAAAAIAESLGLALGDGVTGAVDLAVSRDFGRLHSHSAAAGLSIAWLARRHLQIDAEADAGLAGDAPDVQLALGFAWRP